MLISRSSATEHPTPPRPLNALLSRSRSGVGLTPTLLLLGRLSGFCRLSEGVQFLAELVALPFGLFASLALLGHPLVQRRLRHLAAGTFGAELFPKAAQLVRIIAHNLVQAGRYHTSELLTGRCALCVQCMHIYTCAPSTKGIPLYTVNLAVSFKDLVRLYTPSLYAVVDGIAMDTEEFCGLSDRNVFLALLCALCAVLSH